MVRLLACLALTLTAFFAGGCSTYLGYRSPNTSGKAPGPEQPIQYSQWDFEDPTVDLKVMSPMVISSKEISSQNQQKMKWVLDFNFTSVQHFRFNTPLPFGPIMVEEVYAPWNWFLDGLLGKLWFVPPASLLGGIATILDAAVGPVTFNYHGEDTIKTSAENYFAQGRGCYFMATPLPIY
jgi:hypothetical protein